MKSHSHFKFDGLPSRFAPANAIPLVSSKRRRAPYPLGLNGPCSNQVTDEASARRVVEMSTSQTSAGVLQLGSGRARDALWHRPPSAMGLARPRSRCLWSFARLVPQGVETDEWSAYYHRAASTPRDPGHGNRLDSRPAAECQPTAETAPVPLIYSKRMGTAYPADSARLYRRLATVLV